MKTTLLRKLNSIVVLLCIMMMYCSSYLFGQTLLYTEDFSSSNPTNWTTSNEGSGNTWTLTNTENPYNGLYNMRYIYNSTYAADTRAYTQGISMTAGKSYLVKFYQNTGGTYTEKLKVTAGTAQNSAAQTTTIYTNASLTNTTYTERTTDYFVPPSTGTYYFAFNCYSAADQNTLYLDNVRIYEYDEVMYCTPGSNVAYNDGISQVTLNTLSNADATNTDNGYEDFTAMSTTLQRSGSYSLTVNMNSGGNYTEYAKAYIDWNNDGDFDDTDETNSLGTTYNNSNLASSLSPLTLNVPADAYMGTIRMRIFAKYNAYPSSACATGSDGEIEDYSLVIISSCTPPSTQATTFSASAVTETTMTVGWARGDGDAGVVVVARAGGAVDSDVSSGDTYTANAAYGSGDEVGTGNYVVYKGTGTSVDLTGLVGSTTYHFAIYEYNSSGTCFNDVQLTGNAATDEATVPLAVGVFVAGNVVMNGTWVQTNDDNYLTMNGTSKSITGSGTYTDAKLNSNGTITFNGTISSGLFSKTYVTAAKTFTVNTSKTYKNGTFTNAGTTTLGTGSTFQNSGDWTNNGTITANSTSTAEFNGSTAQVIGGTASTTFYNATIANSSGGVSIAIDETVQNTLLMSSGILTVQGYTLEIGTTSTNGEISGGGSTNYIIAHDEGDGTVGYVKQNVNAVDTYWYPIGDATNYTPLTFDLTVGTLSTADLTVHTKASKIDSLSPGVTNYIDRYWEIDPTGITSPTYDVSYTYVNADIEGAETNMLPVKYSDGTTWYKPAGSSFTDGTEQGNADDTDIASNLLVWRGLTTFSLLGGVADAAIALPVQLTHFGGQKQGRSNELYWSTQSEQNNDFFTIEKTTDGSTYDIVGNQDGAGNSSSPLNYSLMDNDVRSVINYYRLKQTDFDGKYTFSNVISIDNREGASSTSKEVSMRTNLLGQEVNEFYRGVVVILYSDGTSSKVIQ